VRRDRSQDVQVLGDDARSRSPIAAPGGAKHSRVLGSHHAFDLQLRR
jgi:hypothetical protein